MKSRAEERDIFSSKLKMMKKSLQKNVVQFSHFKQRKKEQGIVEIWFKKT